MFDDFETLRSLSGGLLSLAAMSYSIIASVAVSLRPTQTKSPGADSPMVRPPVTLLKPLCGAEPETYGCLKSFFTQTYSPIQIIFGVSDPNDPVIEIVKRLQGEFPRIDAELVIDRRQHGSSRKVSNLVNMMTVKRNELLILSDADIRVSSTYVSKIAAALLATDVGIVTCAYRGAARRGIWSLLGAMYINEWFIPAVRVAAMTGSRDFAFGATIGIRASVLNRIGGFGAIADQLADDYRLGELTRALGLRTVLSTVEVETIVGEKTFLELARHELRWLRTIRAVRPFGYALSLVTCGLPISVAGCLIAKGSLLSLAALGIAMLARAVLHRMTRDAGASASQWLVLPVRDLLTFSLWTWSYCVRSVQWRESRYAISRDGSALPLPESTS